MDVQQMRVYISQHPKYKGSKTWLQKCMCMPDRMVVAIYNKFKAVDYRQEEKKIRLQQDKPEEFHQITLMEYLADKEEKK